MNKTSENRKKDRRTLERREKQNPAKEERRNGQDRRIRIDRRGKN